MAMMTGRVLLVCALCVLWCGVCGGGLAETTQGLLDTASEESESPKKNKDTGGSAGKDGPTAETKAPQAADRGSKEQEGTVEQAAASVPGVTGAGAGMETAPQPGREATESAKGTRGNKEETKKEEESEKELEEGEEEEEEKKEEEREKEKKEEDDTDAKKGISADSQEQRSLPSGAEGASNQTKPKSAQTTDVNDPAAEGAEKRKEKQNENKEANPKKTPVEATAMKTTTATPGDSDSSTAVPHTTSPLLLLLVFACAAAAAVVAA
ncbi:Mucin-associated surface protein (MASP), subgroup S061 [Trypanosoma cruzi]|nr:Mucin-associated surface protein (MASP), subgroup S061 [Trypanosoma cruzi]